MWDLIVSVPDHCLSFYLVMFIRFPMVVVFHICQSISLKFQISTIITLEGVEKTLLYPLSVVLQQQLSIFNAIKYWNSLSLDVKTKSNFNSYKGAAKKSP